MRAGRWIGGFLPVDLARMHADARNEAMKPHRLRGLRNKTQNFAKRNLNKESLIAPGTKISTGLVAKGATVGVMAATGIGATGAAAGLTFGAGGAVIVGAAVLYPIAERITTEVRVRVAEMACRKKSHGNERKKVDNLKLILNEGALVRITYDFERCQEALTVLEEEQYQGLGNCRALKNVLTDYYYFHKRLSKLVYGEALRHLHDFAEVCASKAYEALDLIERCAPKFYERAVELNDCILNHYGTSPRPTVLNENHGVLKWADYRTQKKLRGLNAGATHLIFESSSLGDSEKKWENLERLLRAYPRHGRAAAAAAAGLHAERMRTGPEAPGPLEQGYERVIDVVGDTMKDVVKSHVFGEAFHPGEALSAAALGPSLLAAPVAPLVTMFVEMIVRRESDRRNTNLLNHLCGSGPEQAAERVRVASELLKGGRIDRMAQDHLHLDADIRLLEDNRRTVREDLLRLATDPTYKMRWDPFERCFILLYAIQAKATRMLGLCGLVAMLLGEIAGGEQNLSSRAVSIAKDLDDRCEGFARHNTGGVCDSSLCYHRK